jgi:hypothetical protein
VQNNENVFGSVAQPKSDMENFNEIAANVIQVMSEKNANEHEFDKKRLDLKEQELIHNQSIFKYKFWLLALGLFSLVSISVGLIFILDKSELGMSIISHIGAIVGGVWAGIGYASNKDT